jgi:hypothetical protein
MENWKRALLAGSAGASVILLLKGNRTGGMVFGGIALATLASEYPDEFRRFRRKLPDYIEQGSTFLDIAAKVGERLAYAAEKRGNRWLESLLQT